MVLFLSAQRVVFLKHEPLQITRGPEMNILVVYKKNFEAVHDAGLGEVKGALKSLFPIRPC